MKKVQQEKMLAEPSHTQTHNRYSVAGAKDDNTSNNNSANSSSNLGIMAKRERHRNGNSAIHSNSNFGSNKHNNQIHGGVKCLTK